MLANEQINPILSYLYFKATKEEKLIYKSDIIVIPVIDKEKFYNSPLIKEEN